MIDYQKEYERYKMHFAEWCTFNVMNISDKAMQAVNQKQWAVARLHDTKRDREILLKEKGKLKKTLIEKLIAKNPVNLDKKTLETIENSSQLEAINEQIKDCEFLIRYLEDVVKMITYIAQDIKNILEAMRLETEI